MYISEIKIKNIRCFEDLTLCLEKNNQPILWTMILGDNSVGKTCLLRSIALGLCDQASAAALMKEIPGEFLRQNTPKKRGQYEGSIKITLKKSNDKSKHDRNTYTIETIISKKFKNSPEVVHQVTSPPDNFPWEDIFVCGYGTQRASEADRSYYKYTPLDAVYTLFNYESTLQNPELILKRQPKKIREKLKQRMLDILMLSGNDEKIIFTNRGMEIQSALWGKIPLGSLSDGYRSTTNWVLDFFGWQIYSKKNFDDKNCFGVLLVDELEQHLHPKWQRYIVSRLKKQISNVQFITSTHAPLTAAGMSDIDSAIIIRLYRDKAGKITDEIIPAEELKGMRADQVLTSDAFGLPTARSATSGDKMLRFQELYLRDKNLSKKERREFEKLRATVPNEIPDAGETKEARELNNRTRLLLEEIQKLLTQ